MTFRAFIYLLLVSFGTSASETGLLGGEYSLKFTVLDSDERYPVNLQMIVADNGEVNQVKINYPSYHCQAKKERVSTHQNGFVIGEKVTKGQQICLPSAYKFIAQDKPDYRKPFDGIFAKVLNLTEGNEVATVISEVAFLPTETTSFLLDNGFKSWETLKASGDIESLKAFTAKVGKSEHYNQAVELVYNHASQQNKIGEYVDFLRRYRLEPFRGKAENSLVKLYREQGTMQSYYQAYRLSKAMQDIKTSLNLSPDAVKLEAFIKQHPEIDKISGIEAVKLEAYRAKNSFYGFLKAFELSSFRGDIKQAFQLVKTEGQKYQAEAALGKFLTNLTVDSKQCLIGSIDEQTRNSYKTLASICDTEDREDRINAICFAVSFGGCDYISSKISPHPLLQTITTKECRRQIAKMATEDKELADLTFLLATDSVAIGRKQFLNSNSIVQYFLGMPFAITEAITRVHAISECVVKTRTKCARLYKVCR